MIVPPADAILNDSRGGTFSRIFFQTGFIRGVFSIYHYYRRWEHRSCLESLSTDRGARSALFCVFVFVFMSFLKRRTRAMNGTHAWQNPIVLNKGFTKSETAY
jgi:hypothetical protein